MFGIGFFEICVIAVVALVFVGPKKLPELMRQWGKIFLQVRRMGNEFRDTVDGAVADIERVDQEERNKPK